MATQVRKAALGPGPGRPLRTLARKKGNNTKEISGTTNEYRKCTWEGIDCVILEVSRSVASSQHAALLPYPSPSPSPLTSSPSSKTLCHHSNHFYAYNIHSSIHGPILIPNSSNSPVINSEQYFVDDRPEKWPTSPSSPLQPQYWNFTITDQTPFPPINSSACVDALLTCVDNGNYSEEHVPDCLGQYAWLPTNEAVCNSKASKQKCSHNLSDFITPCLDWESRFSITPIRDIGYGVVSIWSGTWQSGQVLGLYTGALTAFIDETITPYSSCIRSGAAPSSWTRLKRKPKGQGVSSFPVVGVDSLEKGNWTRFINHVCEPLPNAMCVERRVGDKRVLAIVAAREIKTGEEITWSYGKGYWMGKVCQCPAQAHENGKVERRSKGRDFPDAESLVRVPEQVGEVPWGRWREHFRQVSIDGISSASEYVRQFREREQKAQERAITELPKEGFDRRDKSGVLSGGDGHQIGKRASKCSILGDAPPKKRLKNTQSHSPSIEAGDILECGYNILDSKADAVDKEPPKRQPEKTKTRPPSFKRRNILVFVLDILNHKLSP